MMKHSPEFRAGLRSIQSGDILVPPLRAALADPDFSGFAIEVPGIGKRPYDGKFHPSSHPQWPIRPLWLYLVAPDLLMEEPLDPSAILAMTAGSVWHAIIERLLLDLKLLVTNEVHFSDPSTLSVGKADGLVTPRADQDHPDSLFELKGLEMDCPIPTPDGWVAMRDIRVGDRVFDSGGQVCRVLGASEPKWVDGARVHFDDGTSIVCDWDHRWAVWSGSAKAMRSQVLSTSEIAASLVGGHGQSQHRILNTSPLRLDEIKVPIDPYVLGAWIGDGSKHNGAITQGLGSPLWAEIERAGFKVGEPWGSDTQKVPTRTIFGLRTALKEAGLLGVRKHIPGDYLRGSVEQRTSLLQGLMDTDGTWSPLRKNGVYTTTCPDLAEQVRELVVSLGMRCRVQEVLARGFGVERACYHVVLRPYRIWPFRAKAHDDPGDAVRSGRRVIQSIDRLPLIQTRCIEVDSPDHTYLCGRQMVPTHNTMKDIKLSKMVSVDEFIRLNYGYYLQAQEYMRMSGYLKMRFLLMALTYPFEMREFVLPYDPFVGQATADKYRQAIKHRDEQTVPLCDGCKKSTWCPARAVCESASTDQLVAWSRGEEA